MKWRWMSPFLSSFTLLSEMKAFCGDMRCSRLSAGWEGEKELDASKSTVVLYAADVLNSSNGNLSKELWGKRFTGTFEFAYVVVTSALTCGSKHQLPQAYVISVSLSGSLNAC